MNELRASLPPLPARLHRLLVDDRGYPVPYFVAWQDGRPDHRIVDPVKFDRCLRLGLCWICGEPLGRFRSVVVGPMCCVNRVSSEPPQHLDCATFAASACPFLSRPRAQRRDANLPPVTHLPGGIMLERNPGVTAIWTTLHVKPFRANVVANSRGVLFELGDPTSLSFYTEGRPATRAEVDDAVTAGIPALLDAAPPQSDRERAAFDADVARFARLLDRVLPT